MMIECTQLQCRRAFYVTIHKGISVCYLTESSKMGLSTFTRAPAKNLLDWSRVKVLIAAACWIFAFHVVLQVGVQRKKWQSCRRNALLTPTATIGYRYVLTGYWYSTGNVQELLYSTSLNLKSSLHASKVFINCPTAVVFSLLMGICRCRTYGNMQDTESCFWHSIQAQIPSPIAHIVSASPV